MRQSSTTTFPTLQKRNQTMHPQRQSYQVPTHQARNSVGPMQQASQSLNMSKDFIKDFSNKLNKHEDEIGQRDFIINEMQGSIDILKKEYMIEKKKSNEKDQYAQQLQTAYHQLEKKNQQLNIKMEEMQSKIFQYEREFKNLQSNMDSEQQFKERENQYQNNIKELNQQINDKVREVEQQQKQLLEKDQTMQLQSTKLKELEKDIENYLKDIQLHKNQISDKQELLDASKVKIESQEKKILDIQKNFEDKIDKLDSKISQLEQENSQLKRGAQMDKSVKSEFEDLKKQLKQYLDRIENLENQLSSAEKFQQKCKELEQQIKELHLEYKLKQDQEITRQRRQSSKEMDIIKNNLKEQENRNLQLRSDLANTEMENSQLSKMMQNIKSKDQTIRSNITIIDKNELEVMKNLKCNHCNKTIKEPVTIIPCGHNFCFQCKVAYNKQCIKCGPKVKIEAMYRNELLDDILEMAKIMKDTKECLKSLIK